MGAFPATRFVNRQYRSSPLIPPSKDKREERASRLAHTQTAAGWGRDVRAPTGRFYPITAISPVLLIADMSHSGVDSTEKQRHSTDITSFSVLHRKISIRDPASRLLCELGPEAPGDIICRNNIRIVPSAYAKSASKLRITYWLQ
ncbi:hypothetical protein CIB48_g10315 [Xylaria polymorpha]|nr:hypothetical protein CIB48_g10315 [Xylaria polymorpha]